MTDLPVIRVTDEEIADRMREPLKDVARVEFVRPDDPSVPVLVDLTDLPYGTILPCLTDIEESLASRLDGFNVMSLTPPFDYEDRRPAWKSPYDRRYRK